VNIIKLITLSFFLMGSVSAEEMRCGELGAACICSEPFNTNQYTAPNSLIWNPSDSVTKQCSRNAFGTPINTSKEVGLLAKFGNDPTVLNALPSGHNVQYTLQMLEGEPNYQTVRVGADNLDNTEWYGNVPNKRVAVRFYMYHSPDFSFANDLLGESNNTKFFELSGVNSGFWDDKDGKNNFMSYTLYSWTDSNGVSYSTKSSYQNVLLSDSLKGIWMRYEIVVINRDGVSGNGTIMRMYAQDVTNDTPEIKLWDTATDAFTSGVFMGANARPSVPIEDFHTNNYRQDAKNGIPMKGFRAISHFMVAAWDTDTGQRIGAANEIEGQPIPVTKLKATPSVSGLRITRGLDAEPPLEVPDTVECEGTEIKHYQENNSWYKIKGMNLTTLCGQY